MSNARTVAPPVAYDPEVVGPYKIVGRIGAGGMGVVYLGQSATGRTVAVKQIKAEFAADPLFRERFRREVTAARTVSAVYTAAVVDADADAEMPWLATTFVDGPSLWDHVSGQRPLSVAAVQTLALGLAEALAAIHRSGLIHRDIKPSNILLTDAGPYVIDFGITLPFGRTRLTSGLLIGTPSYAAPERLSAGTEVPGG